MRLAVEHSHSQRNGPQIDCWLRRMRSMLRLSNSFDCPQRHNSYSFVVGCLCRYSFPFGVGSDSRSQGQDCARGSTGDCWQIYSSDIPTHICLHNLDYQPSSGGYSYKTLNFKFENSNIHKLTDDDKNRNKSILIIAQLNC